MSGRWLHGLKKAISVGPERSAAARHASVARVEAAFTRLRRDIDSLKWIASNCAQKWASLSAFSAFTSSFGKNLYAASDLPACAAFTRASALSDALTARASAVDAALTPVARDVDALAGRLDALEALRGPWVRAVTDDAYYRDKAGRLGATVHPARGKAADRLARTNRKNVDSAADVAGMSAKLQEDFLAVFRERLAVADRVFRAVFAVFSENARLADFREVTALLAAARFGERPVVVPEEDVRDIQSITHATHTSQGASPAPRPASAKMDASASFASFGNMLRRKSHAVASNSSTGSMGSQNLHAPLVDQHAAPVAPAQAPYFQDRRSVSHSLNHAPGMQSPAPARRRRSDLNRTFGKLRMSRTNADEIAEETFLQGEQQHSFNHDPAMQRVQSAPQYAPHSQPQHYQPDAVPQSHSTGHLSRPSHRHQQSAPQLANQRHMPSAPHGDLHNRQTYQTSPQNSVIGQQPIQKSEEAVWDEHLHRDILETNLPPGIVLSGSLNNIDQRPQSTELPPAPYHPQSNVDTNPGHEQVFTNRMHADQYSNGFQGGPPYIGERTQLKPVDPSLNGNTGAATVQQVAQLPPHHKNAHAGEPRSLIGASYPTRQQGEFESGLYSDVSSPLSSVIPASQQMHTASPSAQSMNPSPTFSTSSVSTPGMVGFSNAHYEQQKEQGQKPGLSVYRTAGHPHGVGSVVQYYENLQQNSGSSSSGMPSAPPLDAFNRRDV